MTLQRPIVGHLWDNEARPKGAGNTSRPLTSTFRLRRHVMAEIQPTVNVCEPYEGRPIKYQAEAAHHDGTCDHCAHTELCIQWTGPWYENGRGKYKPATGKSTTAARYVYAIHYGPIPKGAQVTQSCGNLACVHPGHLKLRASGRGLTVEERLLRRTRKTKSCWLWEGFVDWAGYGQMTIDGRRVGVHRVSYELMVGPIPEGLEIDHLCFTRNCVNPDHLEAVTAYENAARNRSHIAVHMRRLQGRPSGHGTSNRYGSGCRCDECIGWSRTANRQARARRRQEDPVIDCPACGRKTVRSKLQRHQEGWRCIKEAKNRA